MKLALGLNICTYFPRTVDESSSASNFTGFNSLLCLLGQVYDGETYVSLGR
ncbi:hypothetical protein BRARA_F03198 [Brassica rapa]|uniref:Uncharacterized protein n=1 Tax=Brassica campestris TaxID=3711 RepID=A0A397Z2U8_BRACM|nr:hypothetical protein BRARA_F03198 [Brassica rapa]